MRKIINVPEKLKREEIQKIICENEYGYLPPLPYSVKGECIKKTEISDEAFKEEILISVKFDDKTFSFPVNYIYPKKIKDKIPCFVHINYLLTDEGYLLITKNNMSVISFNYTHISTDDDDFTTGVAGLLYKNGERGTYMCGKLGLWAWAALCVAMYAKNLPETDESKVSIVGHSRLGKAALLAGAMGEGIFATFANNSGCGGVSLFRDAQKETITDVYRNFPYWFCENFKNYSHDAYSLPFDQHYVIAAVLPGRLYSANAKDDPWVSYTDEIRALKAAGSYYKAHGAKELEATDIKCGEEYHEGHLAYHLREGGHALKESDWYSFIKYIKLNVV